MIQCQVAADNTVAAPELIMFDFQHISIKYVKHYPLVYHVF